MKTSQKSDELKTFKKGVDKSGTYVKSCSEMPGYGKRLL